MVSCLKLLHGLFCWIWLAQLQQIFAEKFWHCTLHCTLCIAVLYQKLHHMMTCFTVSDWSHYFCCLWFDDVISPLQSSVGSGCGVLKILFECISCLCTSTDAFKRHLKTLSLVPPSAFLSSDSVTLYKWCIIIVVVVVREVACFLCVCSWQRVKWYSMKLITHSI